MAQEMLFLFLVAKVAILARRGAGLRECCSQEANLIPKEKMIRKRREEIQRAYPEEQGGVWCGGDGFRCTERKDIINKRSKVPVIRKTCSNSGTTTY